MKEVLWHFKMRGGDWETGSAGHKESKRRNINYELCLFSVALAKEEVEENIYLENQKSTFLVLKSI